MVRLRQRRGSVLLHVLVTGVIMAFIASSLMGLMIMHFGLVVRAQEGNTNKRAAEGALSNLISNWSQGTGKVCSGNFGGYSCTTTSGNCGCTCTRTGHPRIVTSNDASYCKIEIESYPY